jgi:hypothetical protein
MLWILAGANRTEPVALLAQTLGALPSAADPRHRGTSADSDKANERHVGIAGECMKHKTKKGSDRGKSEQALDQISNVQHGRLLMMADKDTRARRSV